jgi:hypothetical protein
LYNSGDKGKEMTEQSRIDELRTALMCAVIHLFKTDPKQVCDLFTLEEIEEIANETDHLQEARIGEIYKDALRKPPQT